MQVFDASSVIYAWDNYPIGQFPGLWEWIAGQIKQKQMVMPRVAFDEVANKTPDCADWLKEQDIELLEINNAIVQEAKRIKKMIGVANDTPIGEILNYRDVEVMNCWWPDADGLYPLNLRTSKWLYIYLVQSGIVYELQDTITCRESDLVISRENLENYANERGITLKPDAAGTHDSGTGHPDLTIQANEKLVEIKKNAEHKPWPLPKIDLPIVDGRAVLPLRTIPYFTQKIYKPLVLVEHLLNPYGHVVETLEAYRIIDRKRVKFDDPLNYWQGVKERLEGLKDNEDESILALPVSVFVDYQGFRDYISEKHAGMPENDDEKFSLNEGVKFLDDPYIPDSLRDALFKGFEGCFERQNPLEESIEPVKVKKTHNRTGEHGPIQQMLIGAREAYNTAYPEKEARIRSVMSFVSTKILELKKIPREKWPDYLQRVVSVDKDACGKQICLQMEGMTPKRWEYIEKEYSRITKNAPQNTCTYSE